MIQNKTKNFEKDKKKFTEVSKHYEAEFLQELVLLNCKRPSIILRVTDHIPEIVKFIEHLVDSNYAYCVDSGSVYYNSQQPNKAFTFNQLPVESESEFDSKGFIH